MGGVSPARETGRGFPRLVATREMALMPMRSTSPAEVFVGRLR